MSIQSRLHSAEYIKISMTKNLPVASIKYLEELSQKDDIGKQKMLECETQTNLNNKNHFVMYYADDNKCIVVNEN